MLRRTNPVDIPQTFCNSLNELRLEMERNGVELEDEASDCGIVINLPESESEQSVKFCLSLSDCGGSSKASSFCEENNLSSVNLADTDVDQCADSNSTGDSASVSPTDDEQAVVDAKKKEFRLSKLLAISTDEKIERRLAVEASLEKPDMNTSNDSDTKTTSSKGIFDETHEFEYLASESVRRSTSLKTSKSSGSTSVQKKVVRFADAMGLDLESVRHIMGQDEPPIVPLSAIKDLNLTDAWGNSAMGGYGSNDSVISSSSALTEVHRLCCCFAQPGYSPEFFQRVLERNVMLEMAEADDANKIIRGVVAVTNRAFDKTVTVRWTQNGWFSYEDVTATWVNSCNAGTVDRFEFRIQLPAYFGVGCRLEFSVLYLSAGETYWDSNFGANYRIECYLGTEVKWAVGVGLNDVFDNDPFY